MLSIYMRECTVSSTTVYLSSAYEACSAGVPRIMTCKACDVKRTARIYYEMDISERWLTCVQ